MPGVLREPTRVHCLAVVSEAKGLRPSDLGVLVHSTAHVAPSATLGPGTWVQPNATVASMSHLGMCCHVNRNASVGHPHTVGAGFAASIPERTPLDSATWEKG